MPIKSKERKAVFYEQSPNKSECQNWLEQLKDKKGQAKIYLRIRRAERGNFGNYRSLKDNLYELKEPYGPGYRIYFTIANDDEILLLLVGGDKSSQQRDIEKAKEYLHANKN